MNSDIDLFNRADYNLIQYMHTLVVFNSLNKKKGGKEKLFLQSMKLLANKLVCVLH
jgi:hypothetical protein